ncbi:MAG: tagaturonate epimerase family protein [Bacteroidales bacterium]|nr:tagaturonate epimerase family protein [Bacteroidales bacterium]
MDNILFSCTYTKKIINMLQLNKYSFGIGDRFTMQGKAQLNAIIGINKAGIPVAPVWNKSNREHQIVNTGPADTWKEAAESVSALGYEGPWFVDADHINNSNVDPYVAHSNFFTIDVADFIGAQADQEELEQMTLAMEPFTGELRIPGIEKPFVITGDMIYDSVKKFYRAIKEASSIYNRIRTLRKSDDFVPEISMDEVETAQSPVELFFILYMIHHLKIPAQTIAPKFTGRFNKGVDYQGDIRSFRKEFEEDLMVIDHAVRLFGLPGNLKLSVHSGSDKFSIYPVISELIHKHDRGIHVKTAGTTWLEEVIGLAMAGGEALEMAKRIYSLAYGRMDELCAPYAAVIDIKKSELPDPEVVSNWNSARFSNTLRHIPGHRDYDPMFRQLIHVGYKVAAELGDHYIAMIEKHNKIVGEQVKVNILERHLKRLFGQ